MKKYLCTKCMSDNIQIIGDDFGRCLSCGAKLILDDCEQGVVCPKCQSTNVKIIDDDFGKCNDCGAKFIIESTSDGLPDTTAQEDNDEVLRAKMGRDEVADEQLRKETEARQQAVNINVEGVKTQNIKCETCGVSDVTIISDAIAKCNYCGATIALPQAPNAEITNNIIYNNSNFDNSVEMYYIKPTLSEDLFYKVAMYSLATNDKTPPDIFTSEFSPVKSGNHTFLIAGYLVDTTYSATIGYDRLESYEEWDSSSNTYKTKTRTVTDWRPFSGQYSSKKHETLKVWCADSSEMAVDAEYLVDINTNKVFPSLVNDIASENPESIVRINNSTDGFPMPIIPNQNHYDVLEHMAITSAEYDAKSKLPGNHQKDFSASSYAQKTDASLYVIKGYSLYFKYKNKDYSVGSLAAKGASFDNDIPSCESEIESLADKQTSHLKKRNRLLLIMSLICAVVGIVLNFCNTYLQAYGKIVSSSSATTLLVFFYILLSFSIALFVCNIIARAQYKKRYKSIVADAIAENKRIKKAKLKEIFDRQNVKYGEHDFE